MKLGNVFRVLRVEPLALPRPLREHGLPPRTEDEEHLDILLSVSAAMGVLPKTKQDDLTR